MHKILPLLLFLLIQSIGGNLGAQADSTVMYTFGGTSEDVGRDIISTRDKGYLVTGSTGSFGNGNSDIYVLKLDSAFTKQWSIALGGPQIETGYKGLQTLDGGYLILGSTNSFGSGGYDAYVVKLDANGAVEYQESYGGADWDFFYGGAILPDGSSILVGETNSSGNDGSEAFAVKVNVFGIKVWEKTCGGTANDLFRGALITSSNMLLCYGSSGSHNTDKNLDHYLMFLNFDGEEQDKWTFGGELEDGTNHVSETSDGSFLLSGYSKSPQMSVDKDAQMLKVRNDTLVWEKNAGHNSSGSNNNDEFYGSFENSDGNIFYTGYTETFGSGDADIILSVASSGQWDIAGRAGTIGGNVEDVSYAIIKKGNQGAVVVGSTRNFGGIYSNIFVLAVDSVKIFPDFYGDPSVSFIHFEDTLGQDTTLLSADQVNTPSISFFVESDGKHIQISGLPAEDAFLQVYNLSGQLVYEQEVIMNSRIALPFLESAVFIGQLSTQNVSIHKKFQVLSE